MRVLVMLDGVDYALPPFFRIIEQLKTEFEFIAATSQAEVAAACHKMGILVCQFERSRVLPSRWNRLPLMHDIWHEYQQQKAWARQAQWLAEQTQPDVILMSGDFDGLLFYLAQRVRTVVPQVSIMMGSADELIAHWQGESRARQLLCGALALLSKFTRRPLVYQFGNGATALPHGFAVGRTLGAVWGGMRYTIPVKGAQAEALCVNGTAVRQVFAGLGVPPERIYATGSPTHDLFAETLKAYNPAQAAQLKAELNIPPEGVLITFFLQPLNAQMLKGHDYAEEVAGLAQDLAGLDEHIYVALKLHPRHRLDRYRLTEHPRLRWLESQAYPGEDFNNRLVLASRLALTRSSTAGFNAFALDVPLITYAFYDAPLEKVFESIGGSRHVTSRAALLSAAQELLFDENARQAQLAAQQVARQGHMRLDGRCVERIGKVLAGQGIE